MKAIALSLIFFLPNAANAYEFTMADVCHRVFSLKDNSKSYLRWTQELDTCFKDAANLDPEIKKLPKKERAELQKALSCAVHAKTLAEMKACWPEGAKKEKGA